MATKKKEGASGASRGKGSPARKTATRAPRSDAYEVALEKFGAALERLRKDDYAGAREMFQRIAEQTSDETELADRSRTYARICEHRLATDSETPKTSDGLYYQGVVKANQGDLEQAIRLLDAAVELDPRSAKAFYARASARALAGQADASVADLRSAVTIEPTLRFQATNDPDFDRIRDEASFIDVVEPTPSGA